MLYARDVVLAFGRRNQEEIVLRALNLTVESGQVVAISGMAGSGKTTLAAVLSGALAPVSGEVRLSAAPGARRGLMSTAWRQNASLWHRLRAQVGQSFSLYDHVAQAQEANPDLLIVDDAETYPRAELVALVQSRSVTGCATVLFSTDSALLAGLIATRFRLEHGRLVAEAHTSGGEGEFVLFGATELLERAVQSLRVAGVREQVARKVAGILTDADIRGHFSHGVGLLPMYLQRLAAGGINAEVEPVWEKETGVLAIVDACGGFGQVAAAEAAEWCANRAVQHGIAAVGIRHNNHVGMLAAYRWPYQRLQVVGLLLNISGPSVAAPGAAKATLGSNAICLVVPSKSADEPFVVDFGTGVVAAGKVRHALQRHERVPEGWLVDKHGHSSTDPADFDQGGAIPVFGGYKGLGVSIIAEVLAGMLGGATISSLVNKQRAHPELAMNCSQLFIGLSTEAFGVEELDPLVESLHGAVRSGYQTPPVPPYFPNQLELMRTEEARQQGIRIPRQVVAELGWG